ncbi:Methyltransferase domain-containing protein [Desulfotomaculum arcticum]|uniref:Methyltransferase domain-containing protein n=1 Tax=Desulfotruncus arcticus DSM 17038 TaxID=1121424 RepID=A0A1I2UNG6_9FIRM|nr:class I SAM-dependent methyltransferase [Desulfotruncus arcticus]SFG78714.1 Methyltransferase domain-containing protein [Desulfotomaculum arcticum] [Desulfotruncus arcticus DSM 17038]
MGQLFDALAADYDGWYLAPAGRFADRVEKGAVLGYLEVKDGMSVLDIGCGTGNYILMLARLGLRVTGLDISPGMLARARTKAEEAHLNVELIQGDAIALPFENNSFDAVLSVSALEFMPHLGMALQEAYRVLKPDGRLVVGVLGRDSAWGRYYAGKARRNPGSVFNKAKLYTIEELRSAMPGTGVQTRAVLFTPPDFDYTNEQAAAELENTARQAGCTNGGFICAMVVKG